MCVGGFLSLSLSPPLFSLHLDNSGEISISELSCSLEGNPHLGATISAFKSLDVDQTGTIEFIELLRALFPLATHHHVKMMSIEVKAIDITKKDMEILQKLFEWLTKIHRERDRCGVSFVLFSLFPRLTSLSLSLSC